MAGRVDGSTTGFIANTRNDHVRLLVVPLNGKSWNVGSSFDVSDTVSKDQRHPSAVVYCVPPLLYSCRMYDAPVTTCPDHGAIQTQKRIDGNGLNSITVRMYRDEDYHAVRRLFVEGVMAGPGGFMSTALAIFLTYLRRTFAVFCAGLAGLLMASIWSTRDAALILGIQPRWLQWCSSAVCSACLLMAGRILYNYYGLERHILQMVNLQLEKDLQDVVHAYKLRKTDDGNGYESAGPCGFWVAVDGDEVIGEIGLKRPANGDEKIGELSRFNVSLPYRQRGVGKMLMNAVIAHGRASGLEGLWLSTSSLNTAAVNVYKKSGWKLDKVRTIRSGGITAQIINFRLNLA